MTSKAAQELEDVILESMEEDVIYLHRVIEILQTNQHIIIRIAQQKGFSESASKNLATAVLGVLATFGTDMCDAIALVKGGEKKMRAVEMPHPDDTKH